MLKREAFGRDPLVSMPFAPLPLGAIRPHGWLDAQLRLLAMGFTGYLDEFWADVGPTSGWLGGGGESWERGPYYCDGLIPLAYILGEDRLLDKTEAWIEWSLSSQTPDGNFGPVANQDWWPRFVMIKVLISHQQATGDTRVIPFLLRYMGYMAQMLPGQPLRDWGRARGGDLLVNILWVYNQTGEAFLVDLAQEVLRQTTDWTALFRDFPYATKQKAFDHEVHVVNVAMGVKTPGMRYLITGEPAAKEAVWQGIDSLMKYHGQAHGLWSGDEWLAGTAPTQGVETCAVVEYMFSLETLLTALGEPKFGDLLERVAFNALPAALTPDTWGHQYDQQPNQVLCSLAPREWTSNDDTSNTFGLAPNYGCCTANLHQGWPKFAAHLWLASQDGGLACVSPVSCHFEAEVIGARASVQVLGDYPFRESFTITISLDKPSRFPMYLRIPGWVRQPSILIDGEEVLGSTPGEFLRVERDWGIQTQIQVKFPMDVRVVQGPGGGRVVERGPLTYSLQIGEAWKKIGGSVPIPDWEVHPTTPWNYALLAQEEYTVIEEPLRFQPFDCIAPPVRIQTRGKRLPEWGLLHNSAAPLPNPALSDSPPEEITLIPYGCARLRITEFPVVG